MHATSVTNELKWCFVVFAWYFFLFTLYPFQRSPTKNLNRGLLNMQSILTTIVIVLLTIGGSQVVVSIDVFTTNLPWLISEMQYITDLVDTTKSIAEGYNVRPPHEDSRRSTLKEYVSNADEIIQAAQDLAQNISLEIKGQWTHPTDSTISFKSFVKTSVPEIKSLIENARAHLTTFYDYARVHEINLMRRILLSTIWVAHWINWSLPRSVGKIQ